MEESIKVLLSKLDDSMIKKHVICPSAKNLMPRLCDLIPNCIEVIDERSAGYIATGMCEETQSPIVIWCADNDSYRNMMSALTEAYYKKLPVLVISIPCDSPINQSINPTDTIRYYVNSFTGDNAGIENDIEKAIDYLNAEIKGPVYLALFKSASNYYSRTENIDNGKDSVTFDSTEITNLIPTTACVHLGHHITTESRHIQELIQRSNHQTEDGNVSMLIGSSFVSPAQLNVGIFEANEVAYDLNMLGNRHIGKNLIIIVISQVPDNSLYDFAQKMEWDCKRVNISEIEVLKGEFKIGEKPQYMEVLI